jgi:hypothetical protein
MRTLASALLLFAVAGCNSDNNPAPARDMAAHASDMAVADGGGTVGSCDVVAQDCKGATSKCTLTDTGTAQMPALTETCVAPTGTQGLEMTCTRAGDQAGHDDCAPGYWCSFIGWPSTQRHCNKFCHSDTDCPSSEKCYSIDPANAAADGACVKPCTLFGSDCTGGLTCGTLLFDIDATMTNPDSFVACNSKGTAKAGEACMAVSDCVAGTTCAGQASVCVDLCDDSHPCPDTDAGTCGSLALPNNGGLCQ